MSISNTETAVVSTVSGLSVALPVQLLEDLVTRCVSGFVVAVASALVVTLLKKKFFKDKD